MKLFEPPFEFEWDTGNKDKNLQRHGVTNEECEDIFFDPHKRILAEAVYLGEEKRFILVGRTKKGRGLFVVFTPRGNKIRIISARLLNRKERKFLR